MRLLFLSKRHYTHKDALVDRYGRVYELPMAWAAMGEVTTLELIDYRSAIPASRNDGLLKVYSTPVRSPFGLRALGKRAARSRPDVIVASGDCFIGLYALRLARKTGARFVFDVYDDYRAFGAYRVFANFNTFEYLCKRANHILFASRVLAECMVIDTPWTLIPNGVDPSVFCPMDRAQARAAIGLADDGTRWIGYFGGMEAERGAVDLVAAVGQLCVHNPAIRLLLCGPQSSDVLLDAPWVEHHGMVPHEKIPLYINACDVVVLPYRRGPIIDMASSVKIAEYLFCERPIVATRTPNLIKNFEKQAAELGEAICAPGDATDLARAINAQLRHPVVASSPVKHTWDAIAKRALSALRVP